MNNLKTLNAKEPSFFHFSYFLLYLLNYRNVSSIGTNKNLWKK